MNIKSDDASQFCDATEMLNVDFVENGRLWGVIYAILFIVYERLLLLQSVPLVFVVLMKGKKGFSAVTTRNLVLARCACDAVTERHGKQ